MTSNAFRKLGIINTFKIRIQNYQRTLILDNDKVSQWHKILNQWTWTVDSSFIDFNLNIWKWNHQLEKNILKYSRHNLTILVNKMCLYVCISVSVCVWVKIWQNIEDNLEKIFTLICLTNYLISLKELNLWNKIPFFWLS